MWMVGLMQKYTSAQVLGRPWTLILQNCTSYKRKAFICSSSFLSLWPFYRVFELVGLFVLVVYTYLVGFVCFVNVYYPCILRELCFKCLVQLVMMLTQQPCIIKGIDTCYLICFHVGSVGFSLHQFVSLSFVGHCLLLV